MLVLLMASTLRDDTPSIVFEQPNQLTELHDVIVPRDSAGPCLHQSVEGQQRTRDERLAVDEPFRVTSPTDDRTTKPPIAAVRLARTQRGATVSWRNAAERAKE